MELLITGTFNITQTESNNPSVQCLNSWWITTTGQNDDFICLFRSEKKGTSGVLEVKNKWWLAVKYLGDSTSYSPNFGKVGKSQKVFYFHHCHIESPFSSNPKGHKKYPRSLFHVARSTWLFRIFPRGFAVVKTGKSEWSIHLFISLSINPSIHPSNLI